MSKKKRRNRFRPVKEANWTAIKFVSKDVGCRNSVYALAGYHYCTLGELKIARLLTDLGIEFTPDVSFGIKNDRNFRRAQLEDSALKTARIFVPDFVFNGDEYIWTEDDGTEILIHGLECKASNKKPDKVRLLYEQRGIHILVLSDREIDWYDQLGELPLKLLRRRR
ncbi:hypothetical protein KKF05_00335 [Patescibacteria group bacterium]|nr:hypothetical protein [Patescibacteria group bacterium]MBU1028628.1 hypothetical protein [Patescibacteria group bacterium]